MNSTNEQTNEVARLCPHCGGKWDKSIQLFECETSSSADYRTDRCREREMMQKAEAEVERLRELLNRNGDELNTFHHTKEEAFAHAEKAMPLWESVVIKRNTSDGLLFLGGWKVTTSGKLAPAPEEPATEESSVAEPRQLERDNAKLRKIVERYRVWATSESPTQMELDDLKQKYDELN